MKFCACCKKEKEENQFTKCTRNTSTGLSSWCKKCNSIKRQARKEKKRKENKPRFCIICNKIKPLSEFYLTSHYCKKCHNEKQLKESFVRSRKIAKIKYNEKQPICYICKKKIPFQRFFNAKGKSCYCSEKCSKKRFKKYINKHRNLINKRKREWNKNKIKLKPIEYEKQCKFCNNIFKTISKNKIYCSERCRINFYRNKKYNNDILYKLEISLRGRLRCATLRNKPKIAQKVDPTLKLVGCTLDKLKEHLEKQFQQGMTWNNHSFSGWHIDHILPCSSFDLNDPEQQRKCFHYTNLQPLWGKENMKKSNKLNYFKK